MPRFMMHLASPVGRGAFDDSLRFVFPEVAFERHLEGSDGSVRLLCRAPSEAQLRRWALAAGLDVSSILPHAEVTGSEQR